MGKQIQNKNNFLKPVFPWLGSITLLPIIVYYLLNAGSFTFIDYINLLIHEGGHGTFIIFGKFIYTLGGTLMQIIVPGMFVVFYIIKKKKFLAQVFLVWLGENLLNISTYVSDARARKLPLLGGNNVYHDWNWLLGETGLLEHDYLAGNLFFGLGVLIFAAAILIPLFLKESPRAELNPNL